MSIYLKKFTSQNEYLDFKKSKNFVFPNVTVVQEQDNQATHYNMPTSIKCTYLVTSTTEVTKLCNIDPSSFCKCIIIDGKKIEENVAAEYQFNNYGNISVEFIPTNVIETINNSAFTNCKSLSSIDIPDSVTKIGNYAFSGCTSLTSVVIPNSVTEIGNSTFSGCKSLSSIDIPDSVTKIGSSAFSDCSGLTSIVIPDSVTKIGSSIFYHCINLTSIVIPDSVTEFGASVFSRCHNLKEVVLGSKITKLDSYTFANCINLTSIVIPDHVTGIGYSAFSNCKSLTSINIPDSVTSIGESAFQQCSNLTSIVIPNTVTSIGNYAFQYCSGLTSIVIPDGVTSIGNQIFAGCSSLTGITVSSGNANYDSRENCNCIIETASNDLIAGCNNSFIPDSVTSIANYAFQQCSNLTSIIIPDGVTSIGKYAFNSCSSLTGVTIGSGVINIGGYAFFNCKGLSSINIPDGVTSIGENAFYGCSRLGSVTCYAPIAPNIQSNTFNNFKQNGIVYVPAGSDYSSWLNSSIGNRGWFIQEIGVELPELTLDGYDVAALIQPVTTTASTKIFGSSSSLSAVTEMSIDGTVLATPSTGYTFSTACDWHIVRYKLNKNIIPASAFTHVHRIITITASDSITEIGYETFQYCYGLTGITIPDSVTKIGYNAFQGCYGLTSIVIPDSVTEINNFAFDDCSELTGVTIGSGVTSIGNSAVFDGCSSLSSIVVSPDNPVYDSRENCNCIIETATNTLLHGCKNSFIPDSVTSIGGSAFTGCTSLTSITIGSGVTSIGDFAFSGCSGLTELTLGSGVTSIGNYVFIDCSSLNSIVVSEGNTKYDSRENCNCLIETASNRLIQGCNNSFIPNSITEIGYKAFDGCKGLTSIVIPDNVTYIDDHAFDGCSSLISINIPDSVTSIGSSAFTSCTSLTSIVIPDSVTKIGSSTFSGCTSLTAITLGNSVTSIGSSAFTSCTGLTSIDIPDSVTKIGSSAFYGCSSLISINIPDSVTSIGSQAFYDCKGLTSIDIPDSVTEIGGSTFSCCHYLTDVTIGSGVTSIGSQAFYGCSGLTSVTCYAPIAPSIQSNTFQSLSTGGTLYVPTGSDYSSWMSTSNYYLGKYNWTIKEIYTPLKCTSLTITADDVVGNANSTTIHYTAVTNGIDANYNYITKHVITGTTTSEEFPQNTSETNAIRRIIKFKYLSKTNCTTITQGVWVDPSYTVGLNDQWQLSSKIPNPDSSIYDGVYESFSNKGVDNTAAFMYIDIVGYENFKFYVRSYAESSYDYVIVSNLDGELTNNSVSGKMTTKGKQNSGTAIGNYTLVEFTGIDGGEHRITVMYRKDEATASGTDRGYVLIPKEQ